ncbi:UDP-N-acetylglucosamine-peptide N-acetylglucosaminyltransferase [Bradyrhizobium aeschynomenes]|uniref:O-linked N-acetylglucosamine transferase, SPINDLY family protein n=1 Tax=Bradyrhizobium aeschynomenes TaxID=2734909 RepID=UPI001554B029|nr:UDP-N-acetylglucosamine-peptide N-acetylglucosaminyltransferase [Bradyrhizobium aeschynomenes]NPV22141.1 UDP-N-acetylglucosamine-peptide N-acetylglucosaminyltransferase [Bradyrhizobium aeschynomenes]
MRALGRDRSMCAWDDFAQASIDARLSLEQARSGQIPPFLLLSVPGLSAGEHRVCSELWTRDRVAASRAERARLDFRFDLTIRDKLRVGYLSNDFHDHATAHLLIETLEANDRARCELHAFSFGADDRGLMRGRLNDAFDGFHDVTALSDSAAASAVHAAQIDILVDLKGYTRGARTGILMLRPAPVQVNFLGYPGTLGGGICDYIITDPFMTPPAAAVDYSESFAYMPHSYQPHGRAALGPPPSRAEAGLPDGAFVYCCFNQAYKLTPAVFDLWCRLLDAIPDSVLWLLASDQAEGNLRGEALRRGVAPGRLVFAPEMTQSEHLRRLQLADLVLDTAPYGAHTTASDALWAGVPVVSCAGDTFASRVAGSLLHAVGLPELIAADEADYLAVALTLAAEPDLLRAAKAKLQRNRLVAPLFDAPAYARSLQDLYDQMWQRCRSGAAAGPIWASRS